MNIGYTRAHAGNKDPEPVKLEITVKSVKKDHDDCEKEPEITKVYAALYTEDGKCRDKYEDDKRDGGFGKKYGDDHDKKYDKDCDMMNDKDFDKKHDWDNKDFDKKFDKDDKECDKKFDKDDRECDKKHDWDDKDCGKKDGRDDKDWDKDHDDKDKKVTVCADKFEKSDIIKVKSCDDLVCYDLGKYFIEKQGFILELKIKLKNVCPKRRTALALILYELDKYDKEFVRGFKTVLLPPADKHECDEIEVECLRFVVPAELDVSGDCDPCGKRRFIVRYIANYVDSDFSVCGCEFEKFDMKDDKKDDKID